MSSESTADAQTQNRSGNAEHEQLAALVSSFITMMNVGNMARLDVRYGELRLSLRSHGESELSSAPSIRMPPASASVIPVVGAEDETGAHVITAPMIGTFYTSPAPGEPPYVSVGDRVDEGQTIGIIEAMKIMNEIAADRSGAVIELLAGNGQPVEFGSPLVRLDSTGL